MRLYCPQSAAGNAHIRDWVNERLPEQDEFEQSYAVGVVDEETEELVAGAIFSSYSGSNVFLSGAIDERGIGRVNRLALSEMLSVGFKEPLNCTRITALVSPTNKRSQKFVKGLGFKHEGTLRDYMGEDTETLIFGLTRREFEEGRYGRWQGWRRAAS